MKKIIVLLVFLFVLIGCSKESEGNKEVNEELNGHIQNALTAMEKGNYADALEASELALTVDAESEKAQELHNQALEADRDVEKVTIQNILEKGQQDFEAGDYEGAVDALSQLQEPTYSENQALFDEGKTLLETANESLTAGDELRTVFSNDWIGIQENYISTEFAINKIRLGMTIEEATEVFWEPDSIDSMTGQANWTFADGTYLVAFVMDGKINHLVATMPYAELGEDWYMRQGLGAPTATDENDVKYFYRGNSQYLSAFVVGDKVQVDMQYVDDRVKDLHK
jgi:tetratricopeptide (TPR) repeat protein